MNDAALLQAFYDAYIGYFGEEADKVDPGGLDAKDRATLAGIRAAQRIEARSDETLQAAQPERREPDPEGDAPNIRTGGSNV